MDKNSMIGAKINSKQLKTNLEYVKFGKIEGCKIGCGAVQVTENGLDKNAK